MSESIHKITEQNITYAKKIFHGNLDALSSAITGNTGRFMAGHTHPESIVSLVVQMLKALDFFYVSTLLRPFSLAL
jgi:hypothetical protein